MSLINYWSRERYKNLRIGSARFVIAWESGVFNFTFYLYTGDGPVKGTSHGFDFIFNPWPSFHYFRV